MKIGICGGTFDPFHRGHLEPVLAVRGLLEWDRLIYVPAYRQPFKSREQFASGYHRFTMTVLATESIETIFVSAQELDRGEISYTVETLEVLRAQYPEATLDWIIGDDNLAQLEKWKRIGRIFELANFVVLTRHAGPTLSRPGPTESRTYVQSRISGPVARGTHGSVVFAENTAVPVSSTEIRRKIRSGEPIGGLVDPRVSQYIEHNRLYREA